jgi:acyl carrier protein
VPDGIDANDVTEKIIAILVENFEFEGEFTANTPFEEAGIDSLVMLEIAVALERGYQVRFTEDELMEEGTVAAVGGRRRDQLAA